MVAAENDSPATDAGLRGDALDKSPEAAGVMPV